MQVKQQADGPGGTVEVAEEHLVRGDRQQSGKRDAERVPVEDGDPQQGDAEDQELDRDHALVSGACAAMTPLLTASVMAAMSGAR